MDIIRLIYIMACRPVIRVKENGPARHVFDTGISVRRRRRQPCLRWKDQIKEILSSFVFSTAEGVSKVDVPRRNFFLLAILTSITKDLQVLSLFKCFVALSYSTDEVASN